MRAFIDENHSYINYSDRPSRKLYWILFEKGKMVGVFGLGSCFHRPKAVNKFMADNNLEFNEVGNNTVFCLAHHEGRNAGSSLLALCRVDAIDWWYERYGDILKSFQIIRKINCGHYFHQRCADRWLEKKNSCPVCRFKIS